MVLVEDFFEAVVLHAVAGVGNDVAMAQHAALRAAGRTGGIDNLGEVVCPAGPAPFLDLLRRHLRTERLDVGEAAEHAAVDLPHVGERGEPGARGGNHLAMIVCLDDDGDCTRVAEDPLDLLE